MKKIKTALIAIALTSTSYAKTIYSWQLGTFPTETAAKSFIEKLPEKIKKESFIYRTDKGKITVRYKTSETVKNLQKFKELLENAEIEEAFVAPTDEKKIDKPLAPSVEKSSNKKFFSIQLGTFKTVKDAQKFILSLPASVKEEAFIYKTDRGFITVRLGTSTSIKNLKEKGKNLEKYGIYNYFFVPTDIRKIKQKENVTLPEKNTRENILKLSLKIFLGNGELEKALSVTKLGVTLYPDKPFWWEQLAQIATWTENNELALNAYSKLYFKFNKKEVFDKLYPLSIAMQKTDISLSIIEKEAEKGERLVDYKELLSLFRTAGETEKGVNLAEKLYGSNPEILREIAKIYWFYGNREKAMENLEKLKKLNAFTYKDAMTEARIYVSNRNFKRAFEILKTFENTAPESDIEYWHFLSSLALANGDYETAAKVAKLLIKTGKETPYDYTTVITYLYDRNPREALYYTQMAYRETKLEDFAVNFLSTASQLENWEQILNFINSLPEKKRNKLLSQNYPLSTYILALSKTGKRETAMKLIKERISQTPDKEILRTYINSLIELNTPESRKELIRTLSKFKNYQEFIPDTFANAYLFLQNGKAALKAFRGIKTSNYQLLLLKADILELYGKSNEANKIRYSIYKNLKKEEKKLIENPEKLLVYLRVASLYHSHYLKKLEKYKNSLNEKTFKELLYSHSMRTGEAEKVNYKVSRNKESVSPWLQLSLNLRKSNKYKLKKTLEKYGKSLPIRDRTYAFEKIGEIGNAYNVAFKKLNENPYDSLLYRQFRNITVDYKSNWSFRTSLNIFNDYNQIKNSFNYKRYIKNSSYFKISAENTQLYEKENYTGLKNRNSLELSLNKLFDKTQISISGTFFRNTSNIAGGKLEYIHRFKREITFDIGFYLKQPSNESVYLISGGYRTGVITNIQYPVSNRFYISSELSRFNYYTTDKEEIGKGTVLSLSNYYKLRAGYPDFTFKSHIRKTFFSENHQNTLIDRFTVYPPADALPDSSFEIGTGFEFGYENRNSFVRVWRPFFSTGLSYNFSYGTGFYIEGGIGGSLFKRDNLSIESGFSINPENLTDKAIMLNINYKKWF